MTVAHAILRLLTDGPQHGYQLRRQLPVLRHLYPLSNINIYPALKELEEQGLVSCQARVVGTRYRKVYDITEKGRKEFDRWLEQAPDECLPISTDLVSLKLVLAPSGKAAKTRWLSQSITQLDEKIGRWDKGLRARRSAMTPLATLAAEYHVSCLEQRRRYFEAALGIARSEAGGPEPPPPQPLGGPEAAADLSEP